MYFCNILLQKVTDMFKNIICEAATPHENGYVFKMESCPYWLLMCFKTSFYYKADDCFGTGAAGDMLLHPPGAKIEHGPVDKNSCFINDWIYFECDNSLLSSIKPTVNKIIRNNNSEIFTELINSINKENLKNDIYTPQIISNNIHNMLLQYKRISDTQGHEIAVPPKLEQARNTVLSNIQNKWTLKEMASLAGYSVSRFCNVYGEIYGISPVNELIDIRIDKAKYLLSLKSYTVTEVAELCGFSSVHYFSNCFKKRMGISPKEYKR